MALAAELHDRKLTDIRERQGRNRFTQWASDTKNTELVSRFAMLDRTQVRLASDDLPEDFLRCAAMQDFIGFVDREASRNWSADYDISIADSIYAGFVAQAQAVADTIADSAEDQT